MVDKRIETVQHIFLCGLNILYTRVSDASCQVVFEHFEVTYAFLLLLVVYIHNSKCINRVWLSTNTPGARDDPQYNITFWVIYNCETRALESEGMLLC